MESLADAFRSRRLAAGLSQEELAHLTQLSVRTIANLENGRVRRPHAHSVKKLLDALNVIGEDRHFLERWPRQLSTQVANDVDDIAPGPVVEGDIAAVQRDIEVAPVTKTGRPRQLPIGVGNFTGRREEVHRITEHFQRGLESGPPIVIISGQGGIGKTALALQVAHSLTSSYPDGQLFADLGGLDRPQPPTDVLARFLRALGVDGTHVPDESAEKAALFRSIVASRRLLIVLDNIADARQIRPLLPGCGKSAVIATSRDRIDSLEGGTKIDLQLFSSQESFVLLEKLLTTKRLRAEDEAAHDIILACGGLPLAVRVVGARLAARRDTSLSAFARGLLDERHRLNQLRAGDLEVRTSIGLGYSALTPAEQLVLRRLVLLRLDSFSAWVIAPLTDIDTVHASLMADRLAEHHMLETAGVDPGGEPRYRLHDLVRLFLLECAEREEEKGSQRDAVQRALGQWLTVAETLTETLPPPPEAEAKGRDPRRSLDPVMTRELGRDTRDWFQCERSNLESVVEVACTSGFHEYAWQIAVAMTGPCLLYRQYDLLSRVLAEANNSCASANNLRGEAALLAALGRLDVERHRYDDTGRPRLGTLEGSREARARSNNAGPLRTRSRRQAD